MNRVLALVVIAAFGAVTGLPATAQDWGMSDVRTNVFAQTVARFQPTIPDDGAVVNSISTPRVRFRARGQHETGISFDVQADAVRSPALLDARISFPATDRISINTGLFKAPFSGELLDPIQGLDTVDRSRIVRTLAPQRQVGIMARSTGLSSGMSANVGVFNGNGIAPRGNDDNSFMVVGRLEHQAERIRIGANMAKEGDSSALLGADVRYTPGPWIASAEMIHQESNRTGWHATAGRSFSDRRHELLARWDRMAEDDNLLLAGYTFRPVPGVTFQANWILPVEDTTYHRFAVNLQVYI